MDGYWNGWYFGWGWFLWVGVVFLLFSSLGNWGYTYQAHRKFNELYPEKEAFDLLKQRYAKGEINQAEFLQTKRDLSDFAEDTSQREPRKNA